MKTLLRFVARPVLGSLFTTLSLIAADVSRPQLEAQRTALLQEIAALDSLIARAPDPADADRRHDEARRGAKVKALGEVVAALGAPEKPIPAGNGSNGEAPAADAVTKKTVKEAMREVLSEKEELKANFRNYQAFFHLGMNLLNPYTITSAAEGTSRKKIDPSSDTEIGGFLEFVYTNRWAWNEERIANDRLRRRGAQITYGALMASGSEDERKALRMRSEETRSIFAGEGSVLAQVDIQARLGYNFANDSELTANTLVGSSDINAELDVAVPFVAGDFVTGAFTVGPEISYGATTAKNAMDVHHRWFAGIGYSTAFESLYEADGRRRILLHARMGYASVENVRFLNADTREILTINDGTPRYFRERALAFEAEIFFPVRSHSFLTLGARIYGVPSTGPNPWNIYLGITTPLSELVDGLLPK